MTNGGSVSFMHPLARDIAADLWKDSLARAGSGGPVVLGAWKGDDLIGTVTSGPSHAAEPGASRRDRQTDDPCEPLAGGRAHGAARPAR